MVWRKATSVGCVETLAISGVALQLDGYQNDKFTPKRELDKANTWANLQYEFFFNFGSNTDVIAQYYECSTTKWQ